MGAEEINIVRDNGFKDRCRQATNLPVKQDHIRSEKYEAKRKVSFSIVAIVRFRLIVFAHLCADTNST